MSVFTPGYQSWWYCLFKDAALESDGSNLGYAIVTAKDESKANDDYKRNINMKKDCTTRAINADSKKSSQNFTKFSIKNVILVVEYKVYVTLKVQIAD